MRIGLFLNNLDEEYQISVYKGIKAEVQAQNMDLVCVQGETLKHEFEPKNTNSKITLEGKELFPSRNLISVDGILLLSSVLIERSKLLTLPSLKDLFKDIPFISVANRMFECPSIIIKSRSSMEGLMDHLITFHGYRKFLYLGGPQNHQDNTVREHVFRRSIHAASTKFSELEAHVLHGGFDETSAMMLIREYINSKATMIPDVIVAANDNMAIGAQNYLKTQSDSKWRSCAVTGFDDTPQAQLEIPALTTVRQPLDTMGKLAVQTLKNLILKKRVSSVIHIKSELKIRNSCGCKEKFLPLVSNKKNNLLLNTQLSQVQYQSIRSEQNLRAVSFIGQSLTTVYSIHEIIPHLEFFLTNLGIETFYLFFNKMDLIIV